MESHLPHSSAAAGGLIHKASIVICRQLISNVPSGGGGEQDAVPDHRGQWDKPGRSLEFPKEREKLTLLLTQIFKNRDTESRRDWLGAGGGIFDFSVTKDAQSLAIILWM